MFYLMLRGSHGTNQNIKPWQGTTLIWLIVWNVVTVKNFFEVAYNLGLLFILRIQRGVLLFESLVLRLQIGDPCLALFSRVFAGLVGARSHLHLFFCRELSGAILWTGRTPTPSPEKLSHLEYERSRPTSAALTVQQQQYGYSYAESNT